MSSSRSASAAREGGDDFQHLVAWSRILSALPEQRGLVSVEVEALDVGNVDDVVIRSSTQPDEFSQVRYGVDLAKPINAEYLTKTKGNGTSLLSKFHRSWQQLGGSVERPHLQLVTNKLADVNDVVVRSVDGRTGTLGAALGAAASGSALARARTELAAHLGTDESELLALLDDLRLRLGCQYQNEADHVATLMLTGGLHHDANAVRVGIDLVRQWVLNGRRLLAADEVRDEIASAGLVAEDPWATLLIEGIAHDPHANDADVVLDLVDCYEGDSPESRRRVRPGAYDHIDAELLRAAETLRGARHHRVMVSGAMRLATWFAAGRALSEVAGHTVLCGHPAQRWASDERATPLDVQVRRRSIGEGDSLVVALAFATDPTDDVEAAVRRAGLPASSILTISSPNGARIAGQDEANGFAAAIKSAVRGELRDHGNNEVHLFIAAPAGLALLLGHTWNRVAPTTLWEDLGLDGYEVAFRLTA